MIYKLKFKNELGTYLVEAESLQGLSDMMSLMAMNPKELKSVKCLGEIDAREKSKQSVEEEILNYIFEWNRCNKDHKLLCPKTLKQVSEVCDILGLKLVEHEY